jgi:hypothetical protein
MNKVAIMFILLLSVIACQSKKESTLEVAEAEPEIQNEIAPILKVDARTIGPAKSTEQLLIEDAILKMKINESEPSIGYWVGMFGKNKINIAIAEIDQDKALGYTVCAGNYRPITGSVKLVEGEYQFDMNEPGTDQYDGHFVFTLNPDSNSLFGHWDPFKKGIVASKKYKLVKTPYSYNSEIGKFPQASNRLLTKDDVENLLPEELEFMRNEIYARHGYSFKDREDRMQFDTIDWYIPMGIDIRDKLTYIEVQNIDLIYLYEEYYNESYDDYGR